MRWSQHGPHHHHHHHRWGGPGETPPFPWDRVLGEARDRRSGWRRRIRHELRLHYGAHLHRRLFRWFGAAIFLSVGTTIVAAHLGRQWLGAHPWRAVFLFGIPALVLWTAAGRIARRISRPLYQLTRVAQEIGTGNFAARETLGRGGFDEIAVLSTAFHDMAGRLERQLSEQRELLAAVSHELRTPLSRIRLLVEIARQRSGPDAGPDAGKQDAGKQDAGKRDAAKLGADTLDEIEREAIEIDTLVGELLASARIEFQAVTPKPLEAGEVARRALERAGEDATRLTVDAPAVPFSADPTLIARALANLLDNARKHGGGLDAMTVRTRDGFVVFEVADRGPGFAAGDEERAFERFYRGQNSGHASAGAGAGAGAAAAGSLGLGLALVRRIAVAHGGRAGASNRPGGGALLTLEVPVQAPSRPPPATS